MYSHPVAMLMFGTCSWCVFCMLQQTVEAWRTVFYLGAAVYAFGTIVYALFGSGEIQPWAMPKMTEELEAFGDADTDKEKDRERDKEMKEVA